MKLFLREHAVFVVVQLLQVFLFGLIIILDGYGNYLVLLYACLLSILMMFCYLGYMYYTRRHFYKRFERDMRQLDDSLDQTSEVPITNALDTLLKSQYRLYENEIRKLTEQQEEQLLFIDRWVHHMKTPLSVIELTAQQLDEPTSSDLREETEQIKNGLSMALYMARLRTIAEDLHIRSVELASIIHEVNQDNKRFFIRHQVYPNVIVKEESLTVRTDEKWLFFIVTQLVQNAVKYSAGHSRKLDLSIYERNGQAILEVKDYGIGIPKADLRRIFNKFFTGDNGRAHRESTGIGLYLVKEIATELDHVIEVESEVGKGSIFRIIFRPSQNLTLM